VKIVVALDKFKGSVTASAACAAVRRGLLAGRPGTHIVCRPMADGGDGTAEVLHKTLGGRWSTCNVTGPLPSMRRSARYLWLPTRRLAVIEMAAASGLAHLRSSQRNPLRTTTYGTGELIADALRCGAQEILLGAGGSATVDGGVGAAMALGWQFLDATGKPTGLGGGELERIATIVPPAHHRLPLIEVLCDVDNPLCGPVGAARMFGPQKGATPAMVARLDAGLRHLARMVKAQLGKDIRDVRGAGAAGGLAAGAIAFLDARLVPGAAAIMAACELPETLDDADWVLTGEGCFDEQSLRGKVVSGVLDLARQRGVKVGVLASAVRLSEARWRRGGVSTAIQIQTAGMSKSEAMSRARELLTNAARKFGRSL
jgi:glycerate 2-kinase